MAQPKTIFGHGSRCPQTSPVGQACEGNFWHCPTPGRGENMLQTTWFMRTLEREQEWLLVSQLETLNRRRRFTDHKEPASLNQGGIVHRVCQFTSGCMSLLFILFGSRERAMSLLLSQLLWFYMVWFLHTETENYRKWAVMLSFQTQIVWLLSDLILPLAALSYNFVWPKYKIEYYLSLEHMKTDSLTFFKEDATNK